MELDSSTSGNETPRQNHPGAIRTGSLGTSEQRHIEIFEENITQCAEFERILAETASRLSNASDSQFDEVVVASLRTLVEFLGFDRSTLMAFSERGSRFQVTHSWSADGVPPSPRDVLLNTEIPWFTHQIRSGHIVSVSSSIDLPAVAVKERAYLLESGLKSTLAIPLVMEGTIVGAISFGSFRAPRRWPMELVSRLRLVGEILAMGIRRHQYAQGLDAIAQAVEHLSPGKAGPTSKQSDQFRERALRLMQAEQQERRRMGQVLHEDVMQILAAAVLVQSADESAPQQSLSNAKAAAMLREAIQKLRQLTLDLCPEALYALGLADGMHWLANQMRRVHQLDISVRVDTSVQQVSANIRTFLYDSARKLLENVAVHSGSKQARVEVGRCDPGYIRLTVSDSGVGFNATAFRDLAGSSFGLFSIREQVELLGGTLEVTSLIGRGTQASLTLPLD